MDGAILARWSYRAVSCRRVTIVPDGCRDLILRRSPGERPCWFLSPLDERTRHVHVAAGTLLLGFRLKPGARIDEPEFLALTKDPLLQERDPSDCIGSLCVLPESLEEALACLAAHARSVGEAAALLGVTTRTLQRLLVHETGRPPSFWIRLARARRAARAVLDGHALGGVARAHGFSDQAHMTREIRRWFDLTPVEARRETSFQGALHQSGHG